MWNITNMKLTNNTKFAHKINTAMSSIYKVLNSTERKSLLSRQETLRQHLMYNFAPSYVGMEFSMIQLAFSRYWVHNITLDQLYNRIGAIVGDSTDRIIDPCFLTDEDYEAMCGY